MGNGSGEKKVKWSFSESGISGKKIALLIIYLPSVCLQFLLVEGPLNFSTLPGILYIIG